MLKYLTKQRQNEKFTKPSEIMRLEAQKKNNSGKQHDAAADERFQIRSIELAWSPEKLSDESIF